MRVSHLKFEHVTPVLLGKKMPEKSIKQFIGEMKEAFGDGIHSMQVLDAHGVVIKQTDNWIDEVTFLKMEKLRKQQAQITERVSDGRGIKQYARK